MIYFKLAKTYQKLEETPARLAKIDIIANLLKESSKEELEILALLLQGKVFPAWSDKEIGIARKMMIRVIAVSTGFSESNIVKKFNELGDLGQVTEELVSKKKQQTLIKKSLTLEKVFENLQKIANEEGSGSQERKMNLVSELIGFASPLEGKYIVKTILEELRVGVAGGVLRDSIAKAFNVSPKDVENAWFLLPHYGEIAKIVKERGEKGLKQIDIKLGIPINVALAEKSPSLQEALEKYEHPALEFKYDGARCMIHKKGERVWIFTRSLENITNAFPDIVNLVRENVKADCILDSEAVGLDPDGKSVPFQVLSTRIKRKYDIDKVIKDIPVKVYLFDIVYLEGKNLMFLPLKERYKLLKKTIKETERFKLAEHLETKNLKEAKEFYKKSLDSGEEGLILKNLDAHYQPGRRVSGGWLKIKPTMENLDLAIVGGVWGTGKRTGWIGSLILGCRNGDEFLTCGMLGTGIKEKKENPEDLTFEELTKMLKPLIIEEKGNEIKIKPKIIIEVAYEEIQKSPTYSSGYALRFPRFIRLRVEKSESDTLERIETLFNQQKKGDNRKVFK